MGSYETDHLEAEASLMIGDLLVQRSNGLDWNFGNVIQNELIDGYSIEQFPRPRNACMPQSAGIDERLLARCSTIHLCTTAAPLDFWRRRKTGKTPVPGKGFDFSLRPASVLT